VAELRCDHVGAALASREVLSDVDLVVASGALTAILGASGSGKTTLLRVIMGFVRQDRGRVTLGATVVSEVGGRHLPPEKRAVGYMAQEGALYPHLTVAENVGFGLPHAQRRSSQRIDEVLELVGLHAGFGARRPHELSGGEQRRVALARALAPQPPVVLLDEPFSGLDAALRAETRDAVLHALQQEGRTAVLVTHDQAEALSMGREVAVLRGGRLVQTATPDALYRTPADIDVARFVGEAVVLDGHAAGGVVSCGLGDLPLIPRHINGPVQAMIRPEQIRIRRPGSEAPEGSVAAVRAEVLRVAYYGPEAMVTLRVDGVSTAIVARAFSHGRPDAGERVSLAVEGPVMAYPAGEAEARTAPGDRTAPAITTAGLR
jgi:iron(III) transport system ATP-binding protein